MIGMVGTRVPTSYGAAVTQALTRELVNYFTIVSGLALGIDTIAHQTDQTLLIWKYLVGNSSSLTLTYSLRRHWLPPLLLTKFNIMH